VIGLPGGTTVKILHETPSHAQKGTVSENESNEEDNGLDDDDDAESGEEQGVDTELIVGDHGAKVKVERERELINQLNSSCDEEE
jgi:hypothetical protein